METKMFRGGREYVTPMEINKYRDEEETLEVTYWLFDEPNIPNMVSRAGDFLADMYERFGVRPVKIDGNETIFEARYEVVKYGEKLTYQEAVLKENACAFMDFISGVPYGAVEMKIVAWELSTLAFPALPGGDFAVAPIPTSFFDEEHYDQYQTYFNYLFLDADDVDGFIEGLSDEQQTDLLWFTRKNMVLPDEDQAPQTYPTPGEFFAVGIRMFPTKPWGEQESSPYFFSGNWFDTLYYTTAIVDEIEEPTEERPFRLYKVKWRGKEEEVDYDDYNKFLARPSAFEEYAVGDRVAVLKDVDTERTSQTWKDDQEFDEIVWRLAPITFYEQVE